jgi:hypothetical protein
MESSLSNHQRARAGRPLFWIMLSRLRAPTPQACLEPQMPTDENHQPHCMDTQMATDHDIDYAIRANTSSDNM